MADQKFLNNSDQWLAEGWFRNHFEGTLHRKDGEFHRGPERGGGWSDRNLSLMLLDYVNVENGSSRAKLLHKATTRPDLLRLANDWNVPYISQLEWERSTDTDTNWFQLQPISRSYITPYTTKTLYVIAKTSDIPYLSGKYQKPGSFHASIINGENKFIEGRWDWEQSPTHSIFNTSSSLNNNNNNQIKIRPRISQPGVSIYYNENENTEIVDNKKEDNEIVVNGLNGKIVIEFLPCCKLVEIRDIIKIIEDLWNIRKHEFKLGYHKNENTKINKMNNYDNNNKDIKNDNDEEKNQDIIIKEKDNETINNNYRFLSPIDRFIDLPTCNNNLRRNENNAITQDNNLMILHLFPFHFETHHQTSLEKEAEISNKNKNDNNDDDNTIELYLLKYFFDQNSEYEKHEINKILWKVKIEGASNQIAVAAEMKNMYYMMNGQLNEDIHEESQQYNKTYEFVYALIDTCCGKVLSSFTNEKKKNHISSHQLQQYEYKEAEDKEEKEEEKGICEDIDEKQQNRLSLLSPLKHNHTGAESHKGDSEGGTECLSFYQVRDSLLYSR